MSEFILYVVMTFTAFSVEYKSDVPFSIDATYQQPFESLEACESAAQSEKFSMLQFFGPRIIGIARKDFGIEHSCLPTEGEQL